MSMDASAAFPAALHRPEPPWLLRLETAPGSAHEAAWRWTAAGMTCRVLRGAKMRTESACFDETAAALQFPDYFGENWAAFDECLADLSWLPARALALIVTDAEQVLDAEPPQVFALWLEVLTRVAAAWAQPVAAGEAWDRPAVPMHVVLQIEGHLLGVLRSRFAGAEIPPPLTG
jgi:Barstar (barnase inhibitor)